ncbi:hypothetical protein [Halovenus halobia]|jgi:hypothetical protein|uniref:hypothetical protein n=1 Tax=Halovenus halobia TaxID=3396622 RepID=UPI003F574687
MSSVPGLGRLREEPLIHWVGLIVATVAGLGLASLHWLGLVAGGALVGLVATSFKRALLGGLGFGVVVLLVWVSTLMFGGVLGEVLATGQFVWIAVAVGLIAPVIGSLVRGIV